MEVKKEGVEKLRRYGEGGGLIVCNADCNSANFTNSILKGTPGGKPALAKQLFPDYEVRKLPADLPIYTIQFQRRDWKDQPDIQVVGNGSREFMIVLASGDAAKYWQTRTIGGREAFHQVMANIFLYTTEKGEPRFKNQNYVVKRNSAPAERQMKLARLQYGGNLDTTPRGGGAK